jgi:IclR family mhp operon transcriptional activator
MRGTERTLKVLIALNQHNGASVSELSTASGISRQAVYRILETLCYEGYVSRREDLDLYELTPLVRCLSDGFRDEDLVRKIAAPVIRKLQEDIIWPSDLATFHSNAIDKVSIGYRLSMLQSATGRAYLAWCPQKEQDLILSILRTSRHPDDARAHDQHWVRKLLSDTRRRGYAERFSGENSRTGAIALPFRQRDRVMGCLVITFIASALTTSQAARQYIDRLRAATEEIESILNRSS